MGKQVLYVSHDGMTDPLGQSQVIPYLKGLSALNFQVTIVSAEKENKFLAGENMIREQLEENHIGWYPVKYSNTIPGLSPYFTYKRLASVAMKLERKNHFDIVHCRSYIPSLVGLMLKRKTGVKFIFDMRGFWADERVEGGIWNLKNPLFRSAYQFFKGREHEFLKESDAIISLTERAKSEILSRKGLRIEPGKISVIPCCADLDFFSQLNIDKTQQGRLRNELGIAESDFVLSYSGSLGTWYLLQEMLQFFICLIGEKPAAKFLFITTDDPGIIFNEAELLHLGKNYIIIRPGKREEMPLLLSLSSASIFFIRNSFSKKASSPTKMGELMSMGIPIICNEGIGDTDEIINESKAGVRISSLNREGYEEGIRQLLNSVFSKEHITQQAAKFFSLEKGISKYAEIYNSL